MPFRLVWFSRRGRRGGHAHAASPQRCGVNPEALCGVPPVDTEALEMRVVPPKRCVGSCRCWVLQRCECTSSLRAFIALFVSAFA